MMSTQVAVTLIQNSFRDAKSLNDLDFTKNYKDLDYFDKIISKKYSLI